MRSLRAFLASTFRFLYIAPLRDAVVALKGLPLGMRLMGWAGYGGVLALLVVMVVSVIPGVQLRQSVFLTTLSENVEIPANIPILVIVAGLIGLVFGWAYIITGATNSNPFIFLPFAGVFFLQLACLMPLDVNAPLWWLAWLCVIPPLVCAVSVVHLFTHKKAFWRDYPLLEFGIWLVLLALAILFFWLGRGSLAQLTWRAEFVFGALFLLLAPLWLLLSLSVIDLAVDIAARVVGALRRLFPDNVMQALTLLILLSRLAILPSLLIFDLLYQPRIQNLTMKDTPLAAGLAIDATLSILPLLVFLVLLLLRRWDGYRAAKLMALSLVMSIFSIGLTYGMIGMDISNPMEITFQSINFLPSVLVFAVMLVYNVFGVGAKFARVDGRLFSRHGRILLVFGLALIVTSLVIFLTNIHDSSGNSLNIWKDVFQGFLTVGLTLLGLPYLAWIAWRHGERLVGNRSEFESITPHFAALGATSRRAWAMVAVLIACSIIYLTCLLSFVIQSIVTLTA